MDEVDKIILHTLHQIDNSIDDTVSLLNFTPELVIRAVSSCLREIKPNASYPRTLPVAMAQRFSAATTLAEACAGIGYRSDIGYQTFLYPSPVELRRLLMYLIEQLPRDSETGAMESTLQTPINDYEILKREVRAKILNQLHTPWVPQYCRAVANRRQPGCSSQSMKFAPHLNLNIPSAGTRTKEVQQYLQQQSPNVFQQTASWKYDLVSSVLHQNDMDNYGSGLILTDTMSMQDLVPTELAVSSYDNNTKISATSLQSTNEQNSTPPSNFEQLSSEVSELRIQSESLLAERKAHSKTINMLKSQQLESAAETEKLRPRIKIHERTTLILTEPAENVGKLEALIQTTQERRRTLEQQWNDYRKPMLDNLQTQKSAKQAKNIQSVIELRATIDQLENALVEKTVAHNQLNSTLKSAAQNVAPRKEYTRRIHEFIGNIRKQRADIYKVLDDTRDLQKQLNSVGAQLQRQFNYTDDLLFQSAKHDLHAKKAYKLLANVHENCNELVEFVSLTGNVTKEIRDLEVQIDNEKMKNIATSLTQISADIQKFELQIKELQNEIRSVENEITAG